MITSFQFARMLGAQLRSGARVAIGTDYHALGSYYRVSGRLDTGVVFARVEIHVWQEFSRLKEVPPAVWCKESWMRDEADWHNSRSNGMCWVLQEAWCDGMNWKGKRARAILEEGCEWLLNDVRCLINRHYTAFLDDLKEWPKEWPSWGHYTLGTDEYEQEKELRRIGRGR